MPTAISSPQFRDRAERTGPRASFCHFDIGGVIWGGDQTGSSVIVEEGRRAVSVELPGGMFYQCIDEMELACADEEIHLGELLHELGSIPLGQATADDQPAAKPIPLIVR